MLLQPIRYNSYLSSLALLMEESNNKKVYPSRMKGVTHPCLAKGMKQCNFFIPPERKVKVVQYCKMMGITQATFFNRLAIKELEQNYDAVHRRYQVDRLHGRAKAYRYILNRRKK